MRNPENFPTVFSGANAEFLENLYQRYLQAPESFDPAWQRFFAQLENGAGGGAAARTAVGPLHAPVTAVSNQLESALEDIHPDEMPPKEALDALYRLKDID